MNITTLTDHELNGKELNVLCGAGTCSVVKRMKQKNKNKIR